MISAPGLERRSMKNSARAARLIEGGLLEHLGDRVRLTDRGVELADSVFAEFA